MNERIILKAMSSLEKCFIDDDIESKPEKTSYVVFKGERLAFQVAIKCLSRFSLSKEPRKVNVTGGLSEYAEARQVVSVPSVYPVYKDVYDDDYIRTEPGLYPDLIRPLHYEGSISVYPGVLSTVWVTVDVPTDVKGGDYVLTFSLSDRESGEIDASLDVKIHVIDMILPEQKTIHTQWFYTDCIANHYGVKAFSERHWKIIENFISVAVKNGINMILTPLFTPELDTYVGGERLTTQLVGITVEADGSYSFDFSKVDRWVDMCERLGVKYYEIPHFFTQWGSKNAPKIVAKVKGRTKRIFGWETDSTGDEYKHFLGEFIGALVVYLKKRGIANRCYFHVSDEPNMTNIDQYEKCKAMLDEFLGDEFPVTDALSDYEFYKRGIVKKPAVCLKHLDTFLENKIEGLFCYYFGACGCKDYSDVSMSMKLQRARVLGVQMYKFGIEGFLHWGFNFYNNDNSYDVVNPFADTTGNFFGPSGDCFLVYPGKNGKAYESIRLNALREAMVDIRVLELLESKKGKEYVVSLIDRLAKCDMTFKNYPKSADFLLDLYETAALECEA